MLVHGVELIEQNDKVIHHQSKTGKPFEAESIAAWCDAAKGIVLDVGAYTGLYAILAAQRGAEVIAFEPNPEVHSRLLENVRLNGVRVTCYKQAVSDCTGEVSFVGRPGVALTSAGKIVQGAGTEAITIDDLCLEGVSAIKIDVEGHEENVIAGMLETLRKYHPLLITEALSEASLLAQQKLLQPLGYQSRCVDEWNVLWQ